MMPLDYLDYGPAVEAAARSMYERAARERYARTKRDLPTYDEMPEFARYQYREECLEILKVAAPYFAAQGFETGWMEGNGDARSSNITPNPWGDYAQE